MGNKQYKQFKINEIEDGCLVLKSLIVPVIVNLEKFNSYSREAENLYNDNKSTELIAADEYDAIHDKILYRQREILRFIADHQSSSFSYIGVRSLLVKKGFLKRELPEECKNVLKELLEVRNWTFHNAQSMLVAEFENAKKTIPPELVGVAEIKPILNPVVTIKVKNYSRSMLDSFIEHNTERARQFELVLSEMKKDYQEMYGTLPEAASVLVGGGLNCEVRYIQQEIFKQEPLNAGSKIALLSMEIQKGKYDGTDNTFKDLT